jgi:hypothetical protein
VTSKVPLAINNTSGDERNAPFGNSFSAMAMGGGISTHYYEIIRYGHIQ